MVVPVRSVLGRRPLSLRARLVWHSLRWMPAMAEAAADDAFCALRVRGKRRPLDGERGARACVISVGSALDLEPHRMRWAGERRPADGPAGLPPAHAGLSAVDGSSGGAPPSLLHFPGEMRPRPLGASDGRCTATIPERRGLLLLLLP